MFKDYLSMYYLPIDIILIILLVSLILYLFSTYFKETKNNPIKVLFNKGLTGEYLTYRSLNKIKGYKRFIFNLHLNNTEIDIIMICELGIFVIESKNYSGLILGNKSNDKWTEVLKNGQRYSFYNPIKQNNTHINVLKDYLNKYSDYLYSFIVFSNESELRTNIDNVLNRRDLSYKVNNMSINKQLDINEVENIYNLLKNLNKSS